MEPDLQAYMKVIESGIAHGAHEENDDNHHCIMEAFGVTYGLRWGDTHSCVSHAIQGAMVRFNDYARSYGDTTVRELRGELAPFILRIAGTANDELNRRGILDRWIVWLGVRPSLYDGTPRAMAVAMHISNHSPNIDVYRNLRDRFLGQMIGDKK